MCISRESSSKRRQANNFKLYLFPSKEKDIAFCFACCSGKSKAPSRSPLKICLSAVIDEICLKISNMELQAEYLYNEG